MIILARHGQTPSNQAHMTQSAESRVQGFSKDMSLSEVGLSETFLFGPAIGRYLMAKGIEEVLVDSSDAKRAILTRDNALNTSGIGGDKITIRPEDERLRELAKGSLEGMLRSEAYPTEDVRHRQRNDWNFRHGTLESGGETALEAGQRWLEWFNDVEQTVPNKGAVVAFGHGLITAYGLTLLLNQGQDVPPLIEAQEYVLPNCHALVLTKSPAEGWAITDRIAI